MTEDETIVTQEQLTEDLRKNFYLVASLQGRLAYALMSIHAVNPYIFISLTGYNPGPILFKNMVYGMAVNLHSRPHLQIVGGLHRLLFSLLGSLMFNHTTMMAYEWIISVVPENRPYLVTLAGFLTGRILIVYFLAYLYHVDTRSVVGRTLRRNENFEVMYM